MRVILPQNKSGRDWSGVLGRSRDDLIFSILNGGWLRHPDPGAFLSVEEAKQERFCLKFNCYKNEEDHIRMQDALCFDIVFNYHGRRDDARIRSIYFRELRHGGMGRAFLARVGLTTIGIGCKRIWVHPGMEGSYVWPASGALIQKWPLVPVFAKRMEALSSVDGLIIQNWTVADRNHVKAINGDMDVDGLNRLVDRDDVQVLQDGQFASLPRYLFPSVPLGACPFEFDSPLTQKRFLNRTGVDIVAERAAHDHFVPEPPGGGFMGSPRGALMFACH